MDLTGPSLLLVADGRRARLFEERRRGGPLFEITEELGDLTPDHPIASGFRGRTHDRFGPASHTVGGPGPKERLEEAFADQVAARTARIVRARGDLDLVLVAEPRALGRLRRGLAHAGVTAVLAEASDRVAGTEESLRDSLRELRRSA